MITDVWSRKIVGWSVHAEELACNAAKLFKLASVDLKISPAGLVLHSDNGGPMKGSTMLAALRKLGVVASFNRPRVSDDNPYSEALFRAMKYRPDYPRRPFISLEEAREWVAGFTTWYNSTHRHSAIRFVTPDQRQFGDEATIPAKRRRLYERARRRHPERWSGRIRNWSPLEEVHLNPESHPVGRSFCSEAA